MGNLNWSAHAQLLRAKAMQSSFYNEGSDET
jgi:hypothetical protein